MECATDCGSLTHSVFLALHSSLVHTGIRVRGAARPHAIFICSRASRKDLGGVWNRQIWNEFVNGLKS